MLPDWTANLIVAVIGLWFILRINFNFKPISFFLKCIWNPEQFWKNEPN